MVADNSDDSENYIGLMREALEERYSRFRGGYHVSDVVLCPRLQVFKEIDPVPLTDKDLNMYTSGKAIHEAVQWLFMAYKERFDKEKRIEHDDIEGSIDLYDKGKNIPIEFKTSRSNHVDRPKSFHVDQLKYYMAMTNADTGYLIYQCLMHFENMPWRIFRITMTAQQRKDQLTKLIKEIDSLKQARQARNPSLSRHIYYDTNLRWLCKDCPYAEACEKIRNGVDSNIGNGNGESPFHNSGDVHT